MQKVYIFAGQWRHSVEFLAFAMEQFRPDIDGLATDNNRIIFLHKAKERFDLTRREVGNIRHPRQERRIERPPIADIR